MTRGPETGAPAGAAVAPQDASTTERMLAAARELVVRGGASALSMGEVAAIAGVSKSLVHYHFRDKESLLVALVETVGRAVLGRSRAASSREGEAHALDTYWNWLQEELKAGDIRVLLALAEYGSGKVRAASRRVADQRRELTAEHSAQVFSRLGLAPRVPPPLLAETILAFEDGLAANAALDPGRDPRPAFDVLWLALLTLAE